MVAAHAGPQQSQWPIAGQTAAPGAMRSMSGPTAGGFHFLAPATKTANRFLPLDDQGPEHRSEVTLADYVINPKKPRRGKGAPASVILTSSSFCLSSSSSCSSCPCTIPSSTLSPISTKSGGDISVDRLVGPADRHLKPSNRVDVPLNCQHFNVHIQAQRLLCLVFRKKIKC